MKWQLWIRRNINRVDSGSYPTVYILWSNLKASSIVEGRVEEVWGGTSQQQQEWEQTDCRHHSLIALNLRPNLKKSAEMVMSTIPELWMLGASREAIHCLNSKWEKFQNETGNWMLADGAWSGGSRNGTLLRDNLYGRTCSYNISKSENATLPTTTDTWCTTLYIAQLLNKTLHNNGDSEFTQLFQITIIKTFSLRIVSLVCV